MSDIQKAPQYAEKWHKDRGLPVPQLHSDNPDPVGREAEEQKLWEDFINNLEKDVLENLGINKSDRDTKNVNRKK